MIFHLFVFSFDSLLSPINFMKKIIVSFCLVFITACGGGDSSSGAGESTNPGQDFPANFVGTYIGVVNLTASAVGLTESDSFPITVTVLANGTVRFDGDDPDETFTVDITNAGDFAGDISVVEDECTGTLSVTGRVDGSQATGNVTGDGQCTISGVNLSVTLRGDFSANK
ncbi:MAG: hypothetical protein ACI9XU_002217 [Arenicella sp.]